MPLHRHLLFITTLRDFLLFYPGIDSFGFALGQNLIRLDLLYSRVLRILRLLVRGLGEEGAGCAGGEAPGNETLLLKLLP